MFAGFLDSTEAYIFLNALIILSKSIEILLLPLVKDLLLVRYRNILFPGNQSYQFGAI